MNYIVGVMVPKVQGVFRVLGHRKAPAFRLRLLREEEAAQKQRQAGWTVSEASLGCRIHWIAWVIPASVSKGSFSLILGVY